MRPRTEVRPPDPTLFMIGLVLTALVTAGLFWVALYLVAGRS